jgi:hypothetical protein
MKNNLQIITGKNTTAINLYPQKNDGWVIVAGQWHNEMPLTCPVVQKWDRTREQAEAVIAI